jgi:DNA uptake protein ComE-like DNA-binding protein
MRIGIFFLLAGLLLLPSVLLYAENKPAAAIAKLDEPLDPNVATVQQLLTVPGMTRVWAERIVRFRPYTSKPQLKSQGILPPEVYQRVAQSLVVHRKRHDTDTKQHGETP